MLWHFWAEVSRQMLLAGQPDQQPEDVLAILAKNADGQIRPGTLLQQLGCFMLVRSVGIRGASALMSRHCSPRTWQRYKRQLKALPVADVERYSALQQVDAALRQFQTVRLADFQTSD